MSILTNQNVISLFWNWRITSFLYVIIDCLVITSSLYIANYFSYQVSHVIAPINRDFVRLLNNELTGDTIVFSFATKLHGVRGHVVLQVQDILQLCLGVAVLMLQLYKMLINPHCMTSLLVKWQSRNLTTLLHGYPAQHEMIMAHFLFITIKSVHYVIFRFVGWEGWSDVWNAH